LEDGRTLETEFDVEGFLFRDFLKSLIYVCKVYEKKIYFEEGTLFKSSKELFGSIFHRFNQNENYRDKTKNYFERIEGILKYLKFEA